MAGISSPYVLELGFECLFANVGGASYIESANLSHWGAFVVAQRTLIYGGIEGWGIISGKGEGRLGVT